MRVPGSNPIRFGIHLTKCCQFCERCGKQNEIRRFDCLQTLFQVFQILIGILDQQRILAVLWIQDNDVSACQQGREPAAEQFGG